MTTTTRLSLLGVIVLLASGQVLFKQAAESFQLFYPRSWLSPPLLGALAAYGMATVGWVLVLTNVPLTLAVSLYGLAFLIAPLLAWAFLGERLHDSTLVGGAFMVLGIIISSRGLAR